MNIVHVLILFVILLKCVIASADDVASDVIKVVDRKKFEEIRRSWEHWRDRKDLFNYVVTKRIDFIVEFIQQIYDSKRRILEALFDKRPGLVDGVLKRITYEDDDLVFLARDRPELARSLEKFFNILGKMKHLAGQELAIYWCLRSLFDDRKYSLVIRLIHALEMRFRSQTLNDAAVRSAFDISAMRGTRYFVNKFYGHPAVTHKTYADALEKSWDYGKPDANFEFLLSQLMKAI